MQAIGRNPVSLFLACALAVALTAFCAVLPAFAETQDSPLVAATLAEGLAVPQPEADATVSYRVHTRGASWQGWSQSGAKSKAVGVADALRVKVASSLGGGVQYQVYITGKGWQAAKSNGRTAGKLGARYGIEALRLSLTGDLSRYFDVQYRVKPVKGSWGPWVDGGLVAGSPGVGVGLKAVKVRLVKKQVVAEAESDGLVGLRYRVRLKGHAWQEWRGNDALAGSKGKKARMCSLALALDKGSLSGSVEFRLRKVGGKWTSWQAGGASSKSNAGFEAVRIRLTGQLAERYDVVYRVNLRGTGWQKRVRNGEVSGFVGGGVPIRAIRVELVDKAKRAGWVGSGTTWRYYKNGVPLKGRWVKTNESPIDKSLGSSAGKRRYWLDKNGLLAVGRAVRPGDEPDAGAGVLAYATDFGYVLVNDLKMIDGQWYSANANGAMSAWSGDTSELIARYVKWAKAIAADDSHGYSQANRWGPDYDCSSLVVASLSNVGFEVGDALWTGNMKSELTRHGFRWLTDFAALQPGDILLVHNSSRQHTEIYLGGGKTVGAHSSETGGIYGVAGDQTGKEICIDNYYSIWEGYLRYIG